MIVVKQKLPFNIARAPGPGQRPNVVKVRVCRGFLGPSAAIPRCHVRAGCRLRTSPQCVTLSGGFEGCWYTVRAIAPDTLLQYCRCSCAHTNRSGFRPDHVERCRKRWRYTRDRLPFSPSLSLPHTHTHSLSLFLARSPNISTFAPLVALKLTHHPPTPQRVGARGL